MQTEDRPEEMLARQILPSAGAMVGLCTTLVGVVKVGETRGGSSRVDEFSALAAIVFLASAVTAYLAIRYRRRVAFSRRCEQIADLAFLIGLCGLTFVSLLFAYELL